MSGFKFYINGNKSTKKIAYSVAFFLIITGGLIFAYPKIFAFIVAGFMCFFGVLLLLTALFTKNNSSGNDQNDTMNTDYEEIQD
jgi:hypothetical protein